MSRPRRSRSLLIVVAVTMLLLAGCSGADPGGTPTPEPTTPQASGTAPATTTATAPAPATNGTVELHFINVGQSVSTLIVSPSGETMLVDTGHYRDDGEYVLQYLQAHGIDRIDHLVVSHNDADHIGGNAAIIEYYETSADGIGAVYDPGIAASTQTYAAYLDAVEAHDVTLYETREGDRIAFEGVDVQVLGPPEPYLENEARNENSIVLKLTHGQTSFLLSGDAEDDQEAYLVEQYGSQLDSTVLKAGHHGASSSSSGRFLDAVAPAAVVISSGYDNQYDHPTPEVLQRLADRSLPAYWTGTHGDIVLVSDGSAVSIRTQHAAPTDPLALRDADPATVGSGGAVTERTVLGGGSVATQTEQVVTDGGTTTASADPAALAVADVNADAAGDDRENLNDEYVVFENTGDDPLELSGWTVEDEVGQTYTFPDGTTLDPGATVTLHTGSGTDTDTDLYWGSGSPIWNNDGDTVIVRTPDGTVVVEETYE
ncbi:lamin tail domain-containing protein [Halobellus ordinarius]|uniref:lamin tail domain-containing protein n=1 Tax=Halobellus ordinarius TaxID=3075120 RepID=UPI002880B586|nr:lamin tail domain-containing protein [Halobellus sp. ZY16]